MFGDRLKLARKKSGMSMDALVSAMDGQVTKQSLSKYERGLMMPSSRVLTNLSKILDVSLEFFMSAEVQALEGVDFRSQSNTTAKDRAHVEAIVIEHIERYLVIEEILGEEVVSWVERDRLFIRDEPGAEAFAAKIRDDWNLGLDPIPNLTALLEDQGLKVLLLDLPAKVSGLTCFVKRQDGKDSVPVIVVNSKVNIERRRFTLAHELFHRLAEIDPKSELREEKMINHCAGAFLMPRKFIVDELGQHREKIGFQELISLKHRCGVSGAALLVRLGQLGLVSEASVSMAFRTYAKSWRKEEPDPIVEPENTVLEKPERFERLCIRALAERYISAVKAMELLQLSYEQIEMAVKGPSPDASHS